MILSEESGAVTVCDSEGKILYMNKKSQSTFAGDGGARLIGGNVLDCHPEPARSKLATMLKTKDRNCYTIEKNGVKKLIYQAPWYMDSGNTEAWWNCLWKFLRRCLIMFASRKGSRSGDRPPRIK